MMTSQILNSVDFTKTEKSRYLQNETSFCGGGNLSKCKMMLLKTDGIP